MAARHLCRPPSRDQIRVRARTRVACAQAKARTRPRRRCGRHPRCRRRLVRGRCGCHLPRSLRLVRGPQRAQRALLRRTTWAATAQAARTAAGSAAAARAVQSAAAAGAPRLRRDAAEAATARRVVACRRAGAAAVRPAQEAAEAAAAQDTQPVRARPDTPQAGRCEGYTASVRVRARRSARSPPRELAHTRTQHCSRAAACAFAPVERRALRRARARSVASSTRRVLLSQRVRERNGGWPRRRRRRVRARGVSHGAQPRAPRLAALLRRLHTACLRVGRGRKLATCALHRAPRVSLGPRPLARSLLAPPPRTRPAPRAAAPCVAPAALLGAESPSRRVSPARLLFEHRCVWLRARHGVLPAHLLPAAVQRVVLLLLLPPARRPVALRLLFLLLALRRAQLGPARLLGVAYAVLPGHPAV